MAYLSEKNGLILSSDNFICKVVFKSGKISYHLFNKLLSAKRYSESVTKKFSCVAYCEVLPMPEVFNV